MSGSPMDQAKKALELFLHSMPADCYFNIWSFGSTFSSLFRRGSRKYNDFTLSDAKNHVKYMSANFGGTEIYDPLKAIFKEPYFPGYARKIFLLTDGEVSNTDSIIKLVKNGSMYMVDGQKYGLNQHHMADRRSMCQCRSKCGFCPSNSQVFTLGLGSSASRHLVKGVARAGNGVSVFASLNEDLRPKVLSLLKNALMPSLTDVKIQWTKKNVAPSMVQQPSSRSLLGFNKTKEIKNEIVSYPGVLFDDSRMLAFQIL